jgi:GNAT superfamily N-acetyltransferase
MEPIQFLLADGQMATIRPMTLEDTAGIIAMHDRLSKQSLYYRYFVTYKPANEILHEQIQLTQRRGTALIATLNSSREEIIGVAYYVRTQNDSSVGEVAMLVEDRFQGQGLGRALFDLLIQEAQSQALRSLLFVILPDNRRMFNILDSDQFPTKRRYEEGTFEVELSLEPQIM